MTRIEYISRFSGGQLSPEVIGNIQRAARDYNAKHGITGFLISVGTVFFQVIEGPDDTIDTLFNERIRSDPRHTDIVCLRVERGINERHFPEWSMRVFDLNADSALLPRAFRRMVESLADSRDILATYTQPALSTVLSSGRDPRTIPPSRAQRVVLVSDIVDSSRLARTLSPDRLVEVVNEYSTIVTNAVMANGGSVNSFTGDGALALFDGDNVDAAIAAGCELLDGLKKRRASTAPDDPLHELEAGVGLDRGDVVLGNMGPARKKEYAAIGAPIYRATRLERLTRPLQMSLLVSQEVHDAATGQWPFENVGEHQLKGLGSPESVYAVRVD